MWGYPTEYVCPPVTRPRFRYRPPNFDAPPLSGAPEARFEPAPADGVLPDGFFSTTNLPTYLKVGGAWRRPRLPRMDCVVVLHPDGDLVVDQTEFVVNKLRDRGTHQAYGVVTNAQDFMHVLRFYVERWEQAQTPASIAR